MLSKKRYIFQPGEQKFVLTNVDIGRRPGKLSLLLKSCEDGGLRFLSEGFLCPTMRGEVTVKLLNPGETKIHLSAGSPVAFLVLTPFVKSS